MPYLIADLISIVMPMFNKESVLAESIRSVMEQTYPNWELLIVDDASKDGSLQLARQFARDDSRITVISLAANRGVANARNEALSVARGRYVAFLDSDDLWLRDKLLVQLGFMRHHDAAFSFTQYRRLGPSGITGPLLKIPDKVGYHDLLRGNVIGCLTVMMDREKIGDFTMLPVRHEDYVAWLAVLKSGHVALGIQEDLARYRISPLSVSGDKALSATWTWQIYRRTENLSLWKSIWCFANYLIRGVYSRCFG